MLLEVQVICIEVHRWYVLAEFSQRESTCRSRVPILTQNAPSLAPDKAANITRVPYTRSLITGTKYNSVLKYRKYKAYYG